MNEYTVFPKFGKLVRDGFTFRDQIADSPMVTSLHQQDEILAATVLYYEDPPDRHKAPRNKSSGAVSAPQCETSSPSQSSQINAVPLFEDERGRGWDQGVHLRSCKLGPNPLNICTRQFCFAGRTRKKVSPEVSLYSHASRQGSQTMQSPPPVAFLFLGQNVR